MSHTEKAAAKTHGTKHAITAKKRAHFAFWLMLVTENQIVTRLGDGTLHFTVSDADLIQFAAMLDGPADLPTIKAFVANLSALAAKTAKNGVQFSAATLALRELYTTPVPGGGANPYPVGQPCVAGDYEGLLS